jgi:hypothetical protein
MKPNRENMGKRIRIHPFNLLIKNEYEYRDPYYCFLPNMQLDKGEDLFAGSYNRVSATVSCSPSVCVAEYPSA